MTRRIDIASEAPATRFAAVELERYLDRMLAAATPAPTFTLRLLTEAEQAAAGFTGAADDAFVVRPDDAGVLLAGTNPRSILFAVYAYLEAMGCCWLRPGAETVPRLNGGLPPCPELAEQASYRYRTICIEGACSFEHVRDLIDWSAKRRMNGYFIQFNYGACFWRRWYAHEQNPYLDGEANFGIREAREMAERVVPEVARRGMNLERMGHGWTCAVMQVEAEDWEPLDIALTDAQRAVIAEIDGRRELCHGIALNTNLCYSTPAVRQTLVATIIAYAKANPAVSLLHLWLADGVNNHCECAACRELLPSDQYVELLNDVDAALAAANLPTRIVFLVYVDLLWPPRRQRFHNPDRFVLMFAPITRSFHESFADAKIPAGTLPAYQRNKLEFPRDVGTNIRFLRQWQEIFSGDGFDFDYHLIWACHYDLSNMGLARILHRDIRHLRELRLNGFNSCQVQRLSFPHNLLLDVLAQTLWDKTLDFDTIADHSFARCFGDDAPAARRFCERVTRLWAPFCAPVHSPESDEQRRRRGLANLPHIADAAAAMRRRARDNAARADGAVAQSWQYLAAFCDVLDDMLPAFDAYLNRATDVEERFATLYDALWRRESELHPVLDVEMLVRVLSFRVNEAKESGQTTVV